MTPWFRAKCRRLGLALLLASCVPELGWAQDDADLAKNTQNPVADLISVPFQNNKALDEATQKGWTVVDMKRD